MGFRFRKRIRIVEGLYLNLGKRSGSLSVGGEGATANISKKGCPEHIQAAGNRDRLPEQADLDQPKPQAGKR
jgi:hypothetical protein